MRIFLVGMMGSGKTTVGKKVAEALNLKFLDMDEMIEMRHGKSVMKIFEDEGEKVFRESEKRILKEIISEEDEAVVATGGGAVLDPENRELLKKEKTFFLDVPLEELMTRVDPSTRPLIKDDVNKLEKIWEERKKLYMEFEKISLRNLKPWEAVARICMEVVNGNEMIIESNVHPLIIKLGGLKKAKKYRYVFTTERIARIYEPYLSDDSLILPDGEETKSLDYLKVCYEYLMERKMTKDETLIGIGGGALTDLTGFVASTFKRGTGLVLFPTTLLAQVDAAVGGKNAISFGGVKNIVGTIKMPDEVIMDPVVVLSMDDDRFREGLVEAFKMSLLSGRGLEIFIERTTELLKRKLSALIEIVRISAEEKLKVVEKDPNDAGVRKILNLGHTLGHAVESILGIPHGLAVAWGIEKEMALFVKRGMVERKFYEEVRNVLERIVDFSSFESVKAEEVMQLVANDKKGSRSGKIHIPIVDRPGKVQLVPIEPVELMEVL